MARRYTKTTNFIDKETENRYKSIPNYNVEPLSGDDQWIQALDGTRLDLISNDSTFKSSLFINSLIIN